MYCGWLNYNNETNGTSVMQEWQSIETWTPGLQYVRLRTVQYIHNKSRTSIVTCCSQEPARTCFGAIQIFGAVGNFYWCAVISLWVGVQEQIDVPKVS